MDGERASLGMLLLVVGLAVSCDGESAPPPAASPTPTERVRQEPSPSPDVRSVEVTAATCLNIRARPSPEAAVIGCAPNGTVLRLVGEPRRADGRRWLRVAGAWEGWAAAEFLRRTDPPED